jgi:hypothetical protein
MPEPKTAAYMKIFIQHAEKGKSNAYNKNRTMYGSVEGKMAMHGNENGVLAKCDDQKCISWQNGDDQSAHGNANAGLI